MKLPFLKHKSWPRLAKPTEEKLINGDADDQLEAHCMNELFDAVERHDHTAFRAALEALLLNMFETEEEQEDATREG